MPKHIVILSTLDTKPEEAKVLIGLIESQGFKTILKDTSIGGEATVPADISSEEVARASRGNIRDIRASKNTGEVMSIMTKGASLKVLELLAKGRLKLVTPLRGWSSLDYEGSILYDPDEDRLFVEELKRNLAAPLEVEEIICNLEDFQTAKALVDSLIGLMEGQQKKAGIPE
jgi:uncharacterized protein (UPF0261 family)